MHAMHGAALLGLIGFALPLWRVIVGLRSDTPNYIAIGGSAAMSGLCLVFLILCIRSFIAARVARKAREAQTQAPAG
jgi:hypothetical protein